MESIMSFETGDPGVYHNQVTNRSVIRKLGGLLPLIILSSNSKSMQDN